MAAVLFQGTGWADRKIRSNFVKLNHGYAKFSKMQKPPQTFRRRKGWYQTSSIMRTNKYQVLPHETLSPGIYTPLAINGKPIEIRTESFYIKFNRIHSAVSLKWNIIISWIFLGTAVDIPINFRALFVSDVTRLSTVTIQHCLWATLPGFPRLRSALFVSDVTRLSTVTIQHCLWATLLGFPRLRHSLVCEWRHQAFHGYDKALFLSVVNRLSTVTKQPCLWVTSPCFPRLRYSIVCERRY
jgi:hypothetical protein